MCGIVGALSFRNSTFTISASLLTAMRDTMEHRGPDGAGNWISPDRGFGVPIYEWSFQELGNYARTRLEEFAKPTFSM